MKSRNAKKTVGTPARRAQTKDTRSRSKVSLHLSVLLLILFVGLLLRVTYLRELVHAPDYAAPLTDAAFHDYWARALVSGDWTPPEPQPDPEIRTTPFLRPPGYPYFLASVYWLTGSSYLTIRIVQMGLGLLSCVLGYVLGRSLFGRGVGLILAGLLSVYWAFIYYEGELQEPFALVLLALLLILLLRLWAARPSWLRAGAAGLLLGLFALVRPNILLFAPVVVWWLWWVIRRRQGSRHFAISAAALLLGTGLAVLPVTVRNYLVARDFVLISSNGAINLYIGNNAESDGVTARFPELRQLSGQSGWNWFTYPALVRGVATELGRPLKYSEASAYFTRKAIRYIRDNPIRCLRLAAKRALLFWGPAEVSNNKIVHYERRNSSLLRYLPGFPFALATAWLGMLLFLVERRASRGFDTKQSSASPHCSETCLLILLFIAVYSCSFLPFLAAERFRVPVVPFLLLFAAYAWHRLGGWAFARNYRRLAGWSLVGIVLYGVARIPVVPYEPELSAWHQNRGEAYSRGGNVPSAAEEYRAALEITPQDPDLNYNFGRALALQGFVAEAEAAYRRALQVKPQFPDAHVNLGALLQQQGQANEAIAEFRRALSIDPAHARAHYNLGNALSAQSEIDAALQEYHAALQTDPQYTGAWVNLGNAHGRKGQYNDAITAYRRALEIDPRHIAAHYNLAQALNSIGQPRQAIATLNEALRINSNSPVIRQALQTLQKP